MTATQAAKIIERYMQLGFSRKQIVRMLSTGFSHGRPVSKRPKKEEK